MGRATTSLLTTSRRSIRLSAAVFRARSRDVSPHAAKNPKWPRSTTSCRQRLSRRRFSICWSSWGHVAASSSPLRSITVTRHRMADDHLQVGPSCRIRLPAARRLVRIATRVHGSLLSAARTNTPRPGRHCRLSLPTEPAGTQDRNSWRSTAAGSRSSFELSSPFGIERPPGARAADDDRECDADRRCDMRALHRRPSSSD